MATAIRGEGMNRAIKLLAFTASFASFFVACGSETKAVAPAEGENSLASVYISYPMRDAKFCYRDSDRYFCRWQDDFDGYFRNNWSDEMPLGCLYGRELTNLDDWRFNRLRGADLWSIPYCDYNFYDNWYGLGYFPEWDREDFRGRFNRGEWRGDEHGDRGDRGGGDRGDRGDRGEGREHGDSVDTGHTGYGH
jgi:hypothetical protein